MPVNTDFEQEAAAQRRTDAKRREPRRHAPSEPYLIALVFVASSLYLCLFRRFTTIEPDEGILLQGAQRILNGQVLYRDFFSFFTPGSYYLLALVSRIFGNTFIAARTALAVSGGMMSVLTYVLSRRACSRNLAVLVTGIVTTAALPYRFLVLHNWDSTLLACLAVYCALRLIESPQWYRAFALGSALSLTFLFEQSKAAGLLLGLVLGFFILSRKSASCSWFNRTNCASFVGGLIWPVTIALLYFASQHAARTMLGDWFWPLQHYSRANRVPFGSQNWSDSTWHMIFGTDSFGMRLVKILAVSPCFLAPILPLIALAWLVYSSRQSLRDGAHGRRFQYYVLVAAAVAGLLISVLITRADVIHFMYLLPLTAVVLAWIMDGRDIPGKVFQAVRPVLNACIVGAFLIFAVVLLMRSVGAPYHTATRRGTISTPGKDEVIAHVQAHIPSGETMLVYPYLPLYNYLTDTSSPTRYEYFQPGMNTPQQAQEILSALQSHPPRWVLFETSFQEKIPRSWPGTPATAIGPDPLADYVLHNYHVCRSLRSPENWDFALMVHRGNGCPQ